ncbi:MAG: PH domain-containing protein [Gemmatimonadetes bacterium]|nr:PH domain-containing protein [Gemmatimonadota bacterium]
MEGALLRLLRVPPQPQAPAGDTGHVLTFRAAKRYFQYRVTIWVVRQLGTLVAILAGLAFFSTIMAASGSFEGEAAFGIIGRLVGFFGVIELIALAVFVVQLPVSFMLLRLDFEMRWYLLADRSMRIREGLFVVREKTMSYANIQNISIRRNPLQRIFGLATVAVRAAGGGGGASEHAPGSASRTHEVTFESVDNADEIRGILRERIRRHRDSGLGDPDDVHHGIEPGIDVGTAVAGTSSGVLLAAHNLLDEARALRAASIGAAPRAP